MRVLVSVDIEGIAGVSRPDQTRAGAIDYDNARRLMTAEANAAVRGCFDAGATDVLVADGHGGFGNLLPELLDERARLVHGKPRRFGMLEGLQQDCNAVMLIGYHAMAGASGVLAHTMSGLAFHRMWLNERPVGELALYALLAGEHGVPVVMCSGDDALASEVALWLPHTHRVVVKSASGNRAAISVSPAKAAQMITAGAHQSLEDLARATPVTMAAPICCRVEAKNLVQADMFAMLPRSRRTDPLTVEFDASAVSELLGVLYLWAAAASTL